MSNTKQINSRLQQKHDIEANWNKAVNFIPKPGELIIYDSDDNYFYTRMKVGNGVDIVANLPFISNPQIEELLNNIVPIYLLNVDYDVLAFNTKELVFVKKEMANIALLGVAVLGDMILGQN